MKKVIDWSKVDVVGIIKTDNGFMITPAVLTCKEQTSWKGAKLFEYSPFEKFAAKIVAKDAAKYLNLANVVKIEEDNND